MFGEGPQNALGDVPNLQRLPQFYELCPTWI
jgi:hypothetical protein